MTIALADIAEQRDMMARAAWLYYVGGLNQETTARRLGTTRARVIRLLAEARETGLVSISVNPATAGMLPVEEAIRTRFGLDFCHATPAIGLDNPTPDAEPLLAGFALRAVGTAAAAHLRTHLAQTPRAIVGTGWGRTLGQMTLHLAGLTAPQARFISLMGSLTARSAYNPFEVVHELARATGGEGYVLPVPFIADSAEDRHVLLSQRTVTQALEIARSMTVGYISIGELTETSLLRQQEMISAAELAELRAAGAVGDTNGLFFDAEGRAVEHPLNRRTIALGFDDLRRGNTVALVGGTSKLDAARAFLKSGVPRGLIVDGDTALRLAEG